MYRNFNPLREDIRRYIKKKVLKIISEAYMDEEEDDPKYNYFAVSKSNGKIIDAWDYSDIDPQELGQFKYDYFFVDLKDNGIDPKKVKILARCTLERMGIDPDDNSNWSNGEDCLVEGRLRRRQIRENTDEESEDEESLDFYDFIDILEKNGWYYSGWTEVTMPQGQTGVRYRLYPNKGASSFDDLISQLQQAAVSPDCVIPTQGVNRYASEQKVLAVIILD